MPKLLLSASTEAGDELQLQASITYCESRNSRKRTHDTLAVTKGLRNYEEAQSVRGPFDD